MMTDDELSKLMGEPPSKEAIDELVDMIKDRAKKIIEEDDEEHIPMMFAFTPEGLAVVGFELSDMMKETWQIGLPNILRKLKAYAYVMLNEAWVTIALSKDSPISGDVLSGKIRVSELPPDDRKEILMMQVVRNKEYFDFQSADIVHVSNNRRMLGKWKSWLGVKDANKADMVGRMMVKEW